MTTQPVCLVLTRPIWKGSEDPLLAALHALTKGFSKPLPARLRLVSAPLQTLAPAHDQTVCDGLTDFLQSLVISPTEPRDSQASHSRRAEFVSGLLVATSPSCVDALSRLPGTNHVLRQCLQQSQHGWVVTGVGHGSAEAIAGHFGRDAPSSPLSRMVTPEFPEEAGSGAQAFLQWLHQVGLAEGSGRPALLLEGHGNQPTIAERLATDGWRVQRVPLYSRHAQTMASLMPSAPEAASTSGNEVFCVVVSSSALVEPAVQGIAAQGVALSAVRWLTHHEAIAQRLSVATGSLVSPLLLGLSAEQILSCLARLNFDYD